MATANTESAKPNRPRRFAEARGYIARLEQLKAELNERRLTEIAAMLDDAGVPEWVENNSHRGVPSNSAVMRLKWYLARRKNVAPREIDQKLQREMKEAEANAREYMERYNTQAQPWTPSQAKPKPNNGSARVCPKCGQRAFADRCDRCDDETRLAVEIPCPDCYGWHSRPCNICGDTGVALWVPPPNDTLCREARQKDAR